MSATGKETQRPRPAAWSGSSTTEQARVHSRCACLVLTPLLTRSALPRISNSRTLKSRSSGSSSVERLPRCSAGCENSRLRTPGNASLTCGSTAVLSDLDHASLLPRRSPKTPRRPQTSRRYHSVVSARPGGHCT